jgi:hypothetical protein
MAKARAGVRGEGQEGVARERARTQAARGEERGTEQRTHGRGAAPPESRKGRIIIIMIIYSESQFTAV